MWSIGTTECYSSAIKRSEALTHTIVWTRLENIRLSEVSQAQGKMPYDCTYVKYLALAKSSRQKVRGGGNKKGVSSGGDEKVLELDNGGDCTIL